MAPFWKNGRCVLRFFCWPELVYILVFTGHEKEGENIFDFFMICEHYPKLYINFLRKNMV